MNLKKYFSENDNDIQASQRAVLASQARTIPAANALLFATKKRRDELRKKNEDNPKECPEDLKEDYRYIAGEISALNWILELPKDAQEYRNNIEG